MTFHFDLYKIEHSKIKLNEIDAADLRAKYDDHTKGWNASFAMDTFIFMDPTLNDIDSSSFKAPSMKITGSMTMQVDLQQEDIRVGIKDGSSSFAKDGSEAA